MKSIYNLQIHTQCRTSCVRKEYLFSTLYALYRRRKRLVRHLRRPIRAITTKFGAVSLYKEASNGKTPDPTQIHIQSPAWCVRKEYLFATLSALYRRRKRLVRHLRRPVRAITTKFGAVSLEKEAIYILKVHISS